MRSAFSPLKIIKLIEWDTLVASWLTTENSYCPSATSIGVREATFQNLAPKGIYASVAYAQYNIGEHKVALGCFSHNSRGRGKSEPKNLRSIGVHRLAWSQLPEAETVIWG